MTAKIDTIEDLQALVIAGFTDWHSLGHVNVKTNADGTLMLFNYSNKAQIEGTWNAFETMSRGLILNAKTGEIVARPFDKFHNWMEGGRHSTARIVSVTEKMDGSMGILYRKGDSYKIATRGSFDSEQALWATDRLSEYKDLNLLMNRWTLIFEIIYPENRIVVDYNGRSDLVLLAIRNRKTGEYESISTVYRVAMYHGFSLPQNFASFSCVDSIVSTLKDLDGNQEGFVVEFEDGQRFKFKGAQYLALHKAISGLSFKNTLQAVVDGNAKAFVEILPDEFRDIAQGWIDEIEDTVEGIIAEVDTHLCYAPSYDRKAFAQYVNSTCKHLAPYMFAALDGRLLRPIVLKMAFKDRV